MISWKKTQISGIISNNKGGGKRLYNLTKYKFSFEKSLRNYKCSLKNSKACF